VQKKPYYRAVSLDMALVIKVREATANQARIRHALH
jgi:hypothetical protein